MYLCSMNYKNIYNNIINKAKIRIVEGYTEKHHILPKCIGGDNSSDNIVKLTAKEHYLAHRLLTRIYPEEYKLFYAFWMMCNTHTIKYSDFKCSPRAYEEARMLNSIATKKRLEDKNVWIGKTHSNESKLKQSIAAKSRNITNENELIRRRKIAESSLGRKHTEETKLKNSLVKQGNNNPMFGIPSVRRKQINQFDLNGNLIKTWNSLTEIKEFYNLKYGRVNSILRSQKSYSTIQSGIMQIFKNLNRNLKIHLLVLLALVCIIGFVFLIVLFPYLLLLIAGVTVISLAYFIIYMILDNHIR